jgi:hypothetical protein
LSHADACVYDTPPQLSSGPLGCRTNMILKSENVQGLLRIHEGLRAIADVKIDPVTRDAEIKHELQRYSLYRDGFFWGRYSLERGDHVIAVARKRWFSNSYQIQFNGVTYFFDQESVLHRGGITLGSIYCDRDGVLFLDETITIALSDDLPIELKLFCFWLYKRRRSGDGP